MNNNMLMRIASLLLILFSFTLCNGNAGKENHSPNYSHRDTNSITLIFNNYPNTSGKVKLGEGLYFNNTEPNIKVWENFHSRFLTPASNKTDTIQIPVHSDYIMLEHRYNNVTVMTMAIKAGDVIEFRYTNNIPSARLLNGKQKKYDYTIDSLIRAATPQTNGYTAFERYTYPILNYIGAGQNIAGSMNKDREKNAAAAIADFEKAIVIATQLKSQGFLSEENYNLIKDKAGYLIKKMQVELQLIDKVQTNYIIDSACNKAGGNTAYSYYINFLESVAIQRFETVAPFVNTGSGKFRDYRQVFDAVQISDICNTRYKEMILYKYLDLIAKYFSTSDIQKYALRFRQAAKDSMLVNSISSLYFLEFDNARLNSDSLYLVNVHKSRSGFQQLLSNNRGKVIYVDFWASWCQPCRAAMPASIKMKKELEEKNVLFIYLSSDKVYEDWKKAAGEEGLLFYEHNYLIINPASSGYLKQLDISNIPRYLLFDKQGHLVNAKAPPPGSAELIEEINRLLTR
jgi:thiol-disulfide isomerase/thioredoxin